MTPGIGHNSGRVEEPGQSWRRHVWTRARADLLPKLPIEVIRLRVKRAAELGLPYKTYAGVRAASGHDLVGFLFSSNALQVLRDGQKMPEDRRQKLAGLIRASRVGLLHKGITQIDGLDASHAAPPVDATWSDMRDHLKSLARAQGQPADRYLLIGDTAFERDWAEAAQTAGYLPAPDYFAANPL